MTFAAAFWILMLIGVVVGPWAFYPNRWGMGGSLLTILLLGLLGWRIFGAPIHG